MCYALGRSTGTAVVTGANSGIGYAFAQLLINEGWQVVALDKDNGSNIRSLGCDYAQLDVSSSSSMKRFQHEHFAGDRPVDLLLNIADVMAPSDSDKLGSVSLETLEETFSINTYGPLLLTQALLPNILSSTANPRRVVSQKAKPPVAQRRTMVSDLHCGSQLIVCHRQSCQVESVVLPTTLAAVATHTVHLKWPSISSSRTYRLI